MAAKRQGEGYSIGQLQKLTGVPVRTLRSWVAARVLPRPVGKGRGSRYLDDHVWCARAARELRRERLSLRDIRRQLMGMDVDELRALAQAPLTTSVGAKPERAESEGAPDSTRSASASPEGASLESARLKSTRLVSSADSARSEPHDPSYPFATWEVVQLIDGLTLLVNPQRGPAIRRLADEIYRHYSGPASAGDERSNQTRS